MMRTLTRAAVVALSLTLGLVAVLSGTARASTFGISTFSFKATDAGGEPYTQAGGHPYEVASSIAISTQEDSVTKEPEPSQLVKDLAVNVPQGLIGNPLATPRCSHALFLQAKCTGSTQVGTFVVKYGFSIGGEVQIMKGGVYNLVPSAQRPAELGFITELGVVYELSVGVRTGEGYGLTVGESDVPMVALRSAEVNLWGVPADPRHNEQRGLACFVLNGEESCTGGNEPDSDPERPFITMPTNCTGGPLVASPRADSWEEPDVFVEEPLSIEPAVTGCDLLRFDPGLEVAPSTTTADTPDGVVVKLTVPQTESTVSPVTPELRDSTVTLPAGMTVSPSGGEGLEACTDAAFAVRSPAPASCPNASQVGVVQVVTPVLMDTLNGQLFVGAPLCGVSAPCSAKDAEDGTMFRVFLQARGDGVTVKLIGSLSVDRQTGRITASFHDAPQLPFSELEISIKGGSRAPLASSQSCGRATTLSDFVPWSAAGHAEDGTPISGTPDATPESVFDVTGCAMPMPFAPGFEAGTTLPLAGGFSPFTMTLKRNDDEQDLAGVTLSMPAGLAGDVSTVPLCPEPQAAQGTCSPASRIGTVHAAAGAGSEPLWLKGPVYLTGSYKGAPFGLSVVVPAVAGPFNLGNVVERAAININPHTAQVTVTSDPFPQIKDGVPFRLKEVNVTVDRKGFMFNPTNCEQLHVGGTVSADMPNGSPGATAPVSSNFAVAGCRNLPFKPAFSVLTSAKHTRFGGDSLHVVVRSAQGQANLREVHVELPKVLPSRLSTLNLACPEATFAANPAACPAGSRVGVVTAQTPILSVPLTGPAYFVSHGGAKFPELIFVLQGEGVTVQLNGETFISSKGITSSTFKTLPDVPVSRVDVVLPAGKDSVLTGTGDLCAHPLYMPTTLTGQNVAVIKERTRITVAGCKPELIVLRHRAKGATATIVVKTPSAGRLFASGRGLSRAVRRLGKAGVATLRLTLTKTERRLLARHHGRKLKVRVALRFTPRRGHDLARSVTVLIG